MSDFDPVLKRKTLRGNVGPEWSLRLELPPADQPLALHGLSGSMVHEAIYCHVVGLDRYVLPLLRKADEWSRLAARTNDGVGSAWEPGFNVCITSWILTGAPDPEACRVAVKWREEALAYFGYDAQNVRFALSAIVFCGAYADALRIFGLSRKLTPPGALSTIRSEAPMACAVAGHLLNGEHSRDEVSRAVTAFMRRNMNMWLGHGHSVCAATWLYIVHVLLGQSEEPPLDILLKCYDYLPPAVRALR